MTAPGTPAQQDARVTEFLDRHRDEHLAIARVCHEANRAYCATIGDDSQLAWELAPDWQRDSALTGVQGIAIGAITEPGQAHESWLAEKIAAGWRYGPVKDPEAKTHPCLVPFDELPEAQKAKDRVFFAIVASLLSELLTDHLGISAAFHG